MPHLTTGARPVNLNTFIDNHYGPISDEARPRLRETIESSNRAKVVDGTIRLPAIIVTPDDPEVPETERRACESMARGEACRFEARMKPRDVAALGSVMEDFGPAGVSALNAIGAFAQRHKDDFFAVNALISGGNYGVNRRVGAFADALRAYETELNSYILNRHSPAAKQMQHRAAAVRAFQNLQGRFATELQTLARSPRYQTWMYNPYERFAGGIESSLRTNGSPIDALPETRMLQGVLKGTRYLGRGVVAIDIFGRGAKIAASDDKFYTAAREVTGFGASVFGASLSYGGVMLAAGLLSTPVGWTVILSAVGAAAIGGVIGDHLGKGVFDVLADGYAYVVGD